MGDGPTCLTCMPLRVFAERVVWERSRKNVTEGVNHCWLGFWWWGWDTGGFENLCCPWCLWTSVITSVTAQNTLGVTGAHDLPPDFVALQLDAVLSDIGTDAAKTGMLANAGIIAAVAKKVKEYNLGKLVVDPVMVAKGGDHLLAPEANEALKEKLLPLALVVTPNIHEAEVLTGRTISGLADMERAARILYDFGTPHVVVKGGHLEGTATDVLYDGREFHHFPGERFATKNTHGTGCTFAAAIAAGLAAGLPVFEAVLGAKEFINTAIA